MTPAYLRIAKALEGLGLVIGDTGIWSADQLAERVETAAANFAAGRRKGLREAADRSGEFDVDGDW
jgi:hypothetical protein